MLNLLQPFRLHIQSAAKAAAILLLVGSLPAYAATAPSALSPVGSGQPAASAPVMPAAQLPGVNAQTVQVVVAVGLIERRQADSPDWKPVSSGDLLNAFDTIRTGSDGSAHIEFDGKIRLQILPDSELTIEEAFRKNETTRQTLLKLGIGKIKADVDKLAPGSKFEITTPTAVSAVRGTVLYLSVVRFAQGAAGLSTDLFVEKGKVDFLPLEDKLKAVLVEAFHTSSVGGSGDPTPPQELTPEERDALIEAFEAAAEKLGNPQMGIETGFVPGGLGGNLPGGNDDNSDFKDAIGRLIDELIDLRDENSGIEDEKPGDDLNISLLGALKLTAFLLSEGIPGSGDFEYDNISPESGFDLGIVTDERTDVLGQALTAGNVADAAKSLAELQAIRDAEKQELRDTLNSILDDQNFKQRVAEQEKEFDAQTGKVFTDVHGNRVRTDQYIYHRPDSNTVDIVSLTLRTGDYQPGVSSFHFTTEFNQAIPSDTLLRDLPWNEYFNVVTAQDLRDRSATEDRPSGFLGQFGSSPRYEQYIVYSSDQMPSLYPVSFAAEFKNPGPDSDRVTFTERYTDPYGATFLNDENVREARSIQGMSSSETEIRQFGGVSIDRTTRRTFLGTNLTTTRINGLTTITFGDTGDDGAQTADLDAGGFDVSDAFEDLGGSDHPAYFTEDFVDQRLMIINRRPRIVRTDYVLNGVFLPIDNNGQLIDTPGFNVRGVRDLVSPNKSVNGGNYNLETILSFGRRTNNGSTYVEDFRIDTIITPEIFKPYDQGNISLFPDRLEDQDR